MRPTRSCTPLTLKAKKDQTFLQNSVYAPLKNVFCLFRDLWYNYYEEVEAVVYVVDSSDKNRMEESKLLLESILRYLSSDKNRMEESKLLLE